MSGCFIVSIYTTCCFLICLLLLSHINTACLHVVELLTTWQYLIHSLYNHLLPYTSVLYCYRRRLVYKNGECNVSHKHIRKVKRHYLADIFTTLIDLKWRWSLIIFTMTFVSTWLLFAVIWWVIAFTHADLEPNNLADTEYSPCIEKVKDFPTAFLFSLETQHTIGYGGRAVTSECPEAVIMIMIQSITGTLVQALMTGVYPSASSNDWCVS